MSPRQQVLFALTVVVLTAAALRVSPIARESLWVDETFTHWVVTQPLGDAVEVIRRDAVHPPLHYLLTRVAVALAGDGPVGLRLVSLLASIILAGVAFGLARVLTGGDSRAGLAAGLLVAVSDLQIWHANNARSYALWSLLVALLAWSFFLMVTEPGRRSARVSYSTLAVLAVLTHFFGWLYLAALAPVALAAPNRRQAFRHYVILTIPAAVATVLWVASLPALNTSGLEWIADPTPFRVLRTGLILFGIPLMPQGTRYALGAVIILVTLVSVGLTFRPDCRPGYPRTGFWLIGSFLVVPPALILLAWVLTGNSYWVVRQVVPSQAFVAIAAAMGVAVVVKISRLLGLAMLVGLLVLHNPGRWYGPPALLNDPFNLVALDIEARRQPGELTLATSASAVWVLNYYLSGADTAASLRGGRHVSNPSDWTQYPYPPVPDSVVDAAPALWVVSGRNLAPRYDSLLAAGWSAEWDHSYPYAQRPELWPVNVLRLQKLVRRPLSSAAP